MRDNWCNHACWFNTSLPSCFVLTVKNQVFCTEKVVGWSSHRFPQLQCLCPGQNADVSGSLCAVQHIPEKLQPHLTAPLRFKNTAVPSWDSWEQEIQYVRVSVFHRIIKEQRCIVSLPWACQLCPSPVFQYNCPQQPLKKFTETWLEFFLLPGLF